MKKKLILILTILLICLISNNKVFAQVEALVSPQTVSIDGEIQKVEGYNIEDYNYYRLRDLAKILRSLNINFSLSGNDKEIIIGLGEKYKDIDIIEGNTSLILKKLALKKEIQVVLVGSSTKKTYKFSCFNIDGYNYFKLRDISGILGFLVDYNQAKNQVEISSDIKNRRNKLLLGTDRLIEECSSLIDGKTLGLITNQTGVDSNGKRTVDKLYAYENASLKAIYSPEHGLDGKHKAGTYVESYIDDVLGLPVYSLYGKTREPSPDMLKGIDVLIFDIQDIGSRTYTYASSMNYAMKAAKKLGIDFIVLDRPNPLGGEIVEGFVLEDNYKTFVGVDIMPMAHGMTIGELAKYYNRNINCKLSVVEMKNYKRSMIWQDTGLEFMQTSPNIPNLASAFNYMATGIGDGTGLGQDDKFAWIGTKNLKSSEFAKVLNSYSLPGVEFIPEENEDKGGVRLKITDYYKYNPQKTGTYILATANKLGGIKIPELSNGKIPMFEKIHGSDKMTKALKTNLSPEEIVRSYQEELDEFKKIRLKYLIYE